MTLSSVIWQALAHACAISASAAALATEPALASIVSDPRVQQLVAKK